MAALAVAVLGASPARSAAQIVPVVADGGATARDRLRRIDATLASAEAELAMRNERVGEIANALRRPGGGMLVVLLQVDAAAPRTLGRATLSVDEVGADARVYYTAARDALAAGAADELHRGAALAVPHTLTLALVVGERPLSRTLTVTPANDGRTTYVQFVLRDGGLDAASWSGGSPVPQR